jgi:hypothetical protein
MAMIKINEKSVKNTPEQIADTTYHTTYIYIYHLNSFFILFKHEILNS